MNYSEVIARKKILIRHFFSFLHSVIYGYIFRNLRLKSGTKSAGDFHAKYYSNFVFVLSTKKGGIRYADPPDMNTLPK